MQIVANEIRFALQHNDATTHPLDKNNKEPLQRVENSIEAVLVEMLLQLWQELGENLIVMTQEPHELRKAHDVEAMHGKLKIVVKGVIST
jgi:hypothetical protein